jgi:rhodanese-related sulfurtransferase
MKKVVESKSAIVLDARTGKYDDGKRIPGALSLSAESSKAEVEKTIPDKKSAIVTYCSNLKCPASGKLAKHLKALGYTNIKEYPEGIQGWMAAGNPVIEKK